jgi:hypothetical protein
MPLTKWIKGRCLQIHHGWQQITVNNMCGVWKRILPHCAKSNDFEEETVKEEITNIRRELGFDEPENDNVQELLNAHLEEFTDDILFLE